MCDDYNISLIVMLCNLKENNVTDNYSGKENIRTNSNIPSDYNVTRKNIKKVYL